MARIKNWRDAHSLAQLVMPTRHELLSPKAKAARPTRLPKPRARHARQPHHGGVYQQFEQAVRQARHYVYITNAFFFPNTQFLELLQSAHQRRVDVRVLMPMGNGRKLNDWIALSYMPRYLNAGVRVFQYRGRALPRKSAIVDDRWGTVGSVSFDAPFHSREGHIMTTDEEELWQMKRQFFQNLKGSRELGWEQWRTVPLWKKLLGYATRILRKMA